MLEYQLRSITQKGECLINLRTASCGYTVAYPTVCSTPLIGGCIVFLRVVNPIQNKRSIQFRSVVKLVE